MTTESQNTKETAIAKQKFGTYAPTAMDKHATTKEAFRRGVFYAARPKVM
jgi:hypothetical protein